MNSLEKALIEASEDKLKQQKFYEVLSKSDVFFIPYGRTPETIDGRAIENQLVQIEHVTLDDGKTYAPFFSSLEALQSYITQQVNYAQVNTINFFEVIKGNEAVLNPGFQYGKIFLKQEIIDILNGDILKQRSQIVIEKETKLIIGRPSNVPEDLLSVLSNRFSSISSVKEAFLAWVQMETPEDKPHYMIMIKSDSKDRSIFEVTGQLFNQWLNGRNEYLDLIFDSGDGLSNNIRQAGIKFYRKKLFGIL